MMYVMNPIFAVFIVKYFSMSKVNEISDKSGFGDRFFCCIFVGSSD